MNTIHGIEKHADTLPWHNYSAEKSRHPFVIINGMGVNIPDLSPSMSSFDHKRATYNGNFAPFLRELTGQEVAVFYQPGVSPGCLKGYYGEDTLMQPLEVALDKFADGRPIYPIYHSHSTIIGMRLAIKGHPQILPGTISAAVDTIEDSLTDEDGNQQTLFGIPFIYLMHLSKYTPKWLPPLPIYPVYSQEMHDGGKTEKNPNWTASRWIRSATARCMLECNMLQYVQREHSQEITPPLFVITNQDKICSPEHQRAIAEAFHSDTVEIDTGHRWFTADETLTGVIQRIIESQRKMIA